MEKLYKLTIVIGICIAFFYGFQWYQGKQAVQESTMEESELFSAPTVESSINKKERIDNQQPSPDYAVPVVMSDKMNEYTKGEEMAKLEIPSIDSAYTVYWGADDETLDQGVGMYVSEWTTTPDHKKHTVLSGHRDTVFTELGDLEKGNRLALQYKGSLYIYQVKKTWITGADDRTVIVDKDEATLTLTTCYPFEYLGNAPDRYIIESELVEVKQTEGRKAAS